MPQLVLQEYYFLNIENRFIEFKTGYFTQYNVQNYKCVGAVFYMQYMHLFNKVNLDGIHHIIHHLYYNVFTAEGLDLALYIENKETYLSYA